MSKFTYKWLIWDGRYTLQGRCNTFSNSTVDSNITENSLLPTLHIPLGRQDPKKPPISIVSATAVSVRLVKIVESPDHCMAIKIQLKRLKKVDGSWNIKSLMLRVYKNYELPSEDQAIDDEFVSAENLVYQEILKKEQIDQLLEDPVKETDANIPKQTNNLLEWAEDDDNDMQPLHSPYKIRVWISTQKNAFGREEGDLLPFTDEPIAQYTFQVHDQYQPSEKEFLDKFKLGGRSSTWNEFIQKRRKKVQAGKYKNKIGRNITKLSYKTFIAPAAATELVRMTLEEAAKSGVPFTEGLMQVAKGQP